MFSVAAYWEKITHLEFSGGGPSAIAQLGALAYVQDIEHARDFSKGVDGISCCSAGAAVAVVLLLTQYDVTAAVDVLKQIKWHAYNGHGITYAAIRKANAVISKQKGQHEMCAILMRLCGNRDITLKDFYALTNTHLKIRAHDLLTGKTVYLDHNNNATMRLADAVWASMAVPWMHEAVVINGMYLVDGAVSANFAMDAFDVAAENKHGFEVVHAANTMVHVARTFLRNTTLSNTAPDNAWYHQAALNLCISVLCADAQIRTTQRTSAFNVTNIFANVSLAAALMSLAFGTTGVDIEALLQVGHRAQRLWSARMFASMWLVAKCASI